MENHSKASYIKGYILIKHTYCCITLTFIWFLNLRYAHSITHNECWGVIISSNALDLDKYTYCVETGSPRSLQHGNIFERGCHVYLEVNEKNIVSSPWILQKEYLRELVTHTIISLQFFPEVLKVINLNTFV